MLLDVLPLATLLMLQTASAPALKPADLERELAANNDAPIVAWFQANPDEALSLIDSYLEGGLKMIEDGEPAEKAKESFAKGVKFAALANKAFEETIFNQYATAFAGWNAEQQKQFRNGQQAFGLARTALKEGKPKEALEHAEASLKFSKPLGDWWGMAMAYYALGSAHVAAGNHDKAVEPLDEAIKINARLRLRQSEISALQKLAEARRGRNMPKAAVVALEKAEKLAKDGDRPDARPAISKALADARKAAESAEKP